MDKAVKSIMTIKAEPWQVVWFSIRLHVVMYGLKKDNFLWLKQFFVQLFKHR